MNMIFPAVLLIATACGSPPDTVLVNSDDPELRELTARILTDVSERSGLAVLEPVTVAKRSREDLAEYLRVKLDEELSPEEAQRITAVYSMLGLAPAELDLRDLLLSTYLEQVAGFYEPDSTTLFLVDDQGPEVLEAVVVHEIVHALQDQHAPLESLIGRDQRSDARIAAQAAIEGHATLVMMEWTLAQNQRNVDLEDLPDFSAMLGMALAGVRDQYPALAQAPRIVQEGMLYPYLEGAGYVLEFWMGREGRPSPFGEFLPRSTEQVSTPSKRLGSTVDRPLEVVLEGAEGLKEDGLGFMELGVLLEEWVGGAAAREGAQGWGGDTYRLWGEPGKWDLFWVIAWDDAASRDRFVEITSSFLPDGVTLTSSRVGDVPVVEVRVGDPPPTSVSIHLGETP